MKPPICSFCYSRFSAAKTRGTTLKFAISAEDEAFNQNMRDTRRKGHLKGLHWMCEAHIDAAREFTHLHWPEARAEMEKRYRDF